MASLDADFRGMKVFFQSEPHPATGPSGTPFSQPAREQVKMLVGPIHRSAMQGRGHGTRCPTAAIVRSGNAQSSRPGATAVILPMPQIMRFVVVALLTCIVGDSQNRSVTQEVRVAHCEIAHGSGLLPGPRQAIARATSAVWLRSQVGPALRIGSGGRTSPSDSRRRVS